MKGTASRTPKLNLGIGRGRQDQDLEFTESACEVGDRPHGYLNQHCYNGSPTRLSGELESLR
jgi:hypothetical protein